MRKSHTRLIGSSPTPMMCAMNGENDDSGESQEYSRSGCKTNYRQFGHTAGTEGIQTPLKYSM